MRTVSDASIPCTIELLSPHKQQIHKGHAVPETARAFRIILQISCTAQYIVSSSGPLDIEYCYLMLTLPPYDEKFLFPMLALCWLCPDHMMPCDPPHTAVFHSLERATRHYIHWAYPEKGVG